LTQRSTLEHLALYYASDDEYASGVAGFAEQGLDAGHPVMIAVPGERLTALRDRLGERAHQVSWFDMASLGRNPARIIPAIRVFADRAAGRPARMVGEPIWRGRSDAELSEATHHEALINLAFADTPITILCPYDLRLDERTLADSRCTHPELVLDSAPSGSGDYRPARLLEVGRRPLPPAPQRAVTFAAVTDVFDLRNGLRGQVQSVLTGDRAEDLVLAVSEAVSNSLRHANDPPTIRVWQEPGAVVCDIADRGVITDPLVGRWPPDTRVEGRRGLWLVNQLCDLSELRSDESGTTLRLHMRV
jgi:anti-sigma regulatory factor (Ser/Thr protein kinase)